MFRQSNMSVFSKLIAAVLCLGLLVSVLPMADRSEAVRPIAVFMDGQPVAMRTTPTTVNGRLMVGMDVILQAFQAEVTWSETARTVNVRRHNQIIVMTLDNPVAQVNGRPAEMGVAARFINGHVMIPLRFVSGVFGVSVAWDAAASAVLLTFTEASRRSVTNAIFFHPDGFGMSHWNALRTFLHGPQGRLNWDRLPHMAIYTDNMLDALTASSHGGATIHAYGVKVARDSFGLDRHSEITALSGKQMSIMEEAVQSGFATALVQTGGLIEPGTAAFVASVPERGMFDEIARQVIESGVDVILGGGERWLLPAGVAGRHGVGARADNINLIERARTLGYTIVYTRDELLALGPTVTRVLGVFAHGTTYNDLTEEALRTRNLPLYVPGTPSVAEMSRAALEILGRTSKAQNRGIFLVVEEEGTDNFGNVANARGSLEAGRRADEAFGVFADFVEKNPNTLLVTAADSSAGGMAVLGEDAEGMPRLATGNRVGAIDFNSGADGVYVRAPLDGADGASTPPFMAPPDRGELVRLPFTVAWATRSDLSGAVLARAKGLNAERLSAMGVIDNTDIYRLLYYTLFGKWLEERTPAVADTNNLRLQILSINDFHGALETRTSGGRAIGGAAMLAAYLDAWEARAKNDGFQTIRVQAGDLFGASPPISALLQHESTVQVADAMRFSFGAIGNHELNSGLHELLRLVHGGTHPRTTPISGAFRGMQFQRYLAANVVSRQTGRPVLPPYAIQTIDGVRVGFIGISKRDTPTVVMPDGIRDIEFLDEVQTVNRYVAELQRQGVQSIVVILHAGNRSTAVGGQLVDDAHFVPMVRSMSPEVDVVISADSHRAYWGYVDDKLVVQANHSGMAFANIELSIDRATGEVVARTAEIVHTFHDQANFPPNAAIAAMVTRFAELVRPQVEQGVGVAARELTRTANAAGESALGNLIADAQRWRMGTDVAFMNPGGIRDNIPAGNVTWGRLFTVQPFGNDLVRLEMTVAQIKRLLEQQWQGQPFPRILQISGLTYTWDSALPDGSRVVEVRIGGQVVVANGVLVEPNRVFSATVNSFIASGIGDNFFVLGEPTVRTTGPVDLDVLIDYVRTVLPTPFNAAIDGRITRR